MNPIAFAIRRPFKTLVLLAALGGGAAFGLSKIRPDIVPPLNVAKVQSYLDHARTIAMQAKSYVSGSSESTSEHKGSEEAEAHRKILASSPKSQDVILTQEYVCQIHAQRHINVCAFDNGYLEEINVREGQAVKKGDLLFRIRPVLYKAKLDAELAEAKLAQLEYSYSKQLSESKLPVVSKNEVALLEAKMAKANAKADLAKAELNFTNVVAPYDGIIDRLQQQLGSLIKEGDVLTTLSDNSLMWVYFNVPERNYLEYMAALNHDMSDQQIELVLANGETFKQAGKIGAIEAKFNNQTGNIPFRADFPNPADGRTHNRLLRHGQTGTVRIRHIAKDALVLPQRATFEILDKRYVYVIDKDDVVHQREIVVDTEMDDIYLIKKGIGVKDRVVLEGMRDIRDGEKVAYEFQQPEIVIAHLKNRAE